MALCPSEDSLRRLGSDSLGAASFAALERHVEGCPACQGILERHLDEDAAPLDLAAPRLPEREHLPEIPGCVLEEELGRGGMGVVFRATQPELGRAVAVKILASGPLAGERDRRRWLREARAIAKLRHPNVVPLHDAGEAGGWFYLVLDLVPGGSLERRLTGPLAPKTAARLMVMIAEAVEAIHRAGLRHLDLKPANLLVEEPPGTPLDRATIRVSDFGLTRPPLGSSSLRA